VPRSQASYAKIPEALVVGLARKGNRDAFAELVTRRQSWVRNLMRRSCGDATLADDLAQQVFLQAWRNIHSLREPGAFGGWLRRLAVTCWLQHMRAQDALHGANELSGIMPESTGASGVATDMGMDLDAALATLPGPVRLCIVLAYHERMTHGEIADLAGLPPGTVKSHIRRGTDRLRSLLSAYRDAPSSEDLS